MHAALEGGTDILQAERHGDVAIRPKGRDEDVFRVLAEYSLI